MPEGRSCRLPLSNPHLNPPPSKGRRYNIFLPTCMGRTKERVEYTRMDKLTRINPKGKVRSRHLRRKMTMSEQMLWQGLRKRQMRSYKFRRQHPYENYVLDFVCLETRLVIEVDGGQHQERIDYDTKRTQWLEHQGFQVLRFWNNEVMNNLEGVLDVVWRSLHLGIQPPSQPSP